MDGRGVEGNGESLSKRSSLSVWKKGSGNGSFNGGRRSADPHPLIHGGERTLKRLHLSKALTIPQSTTIHEACRRMAARRVDAVLLTDANAFLCGILTDKDIATRVIAHELPLEETPVSKVMTKNPVFVLSDALAVEALQKMVQGKFRHLPVVENGEVIALLDIARCLYDAIARMERAAEKGKAVAAAVEGVEKHWGASISGPTTLIETLQERMFIPSLSTVMPENSKVVKVSPIDTVLTATKKMLELKMSSVVIVVEDKPQGILTSRDILMRVIAQNLSPGSTPVEKVMTPNPACGTVDTPIVDALHTMHEGKFLHIPVVDRDGNIVSVVDVIHITHAAVVTVGSSGGFGAESTHSLMQKLWDSAMSAGPFEDNVDNRSDKFATDAQTMRSSVIYRSSSPSGFGFKFQDRKGRMHRFNCDASSLTDLLTSILKRAGTDIDRNNAPLILYEDEDNDKVVIASDGDLQAAVEHARQLGWKGLRLHLEFPRSTVGRKKCSGSTVIEHASAYSAVAAGAAVVVGLGVVAYLKRSGT